MTTTDTARTTTPQQINRRIAEACGWTQFEELADHCGTYGWWGVPPSRDTDIPILSYASDLNAMHEAEGTLKSPKKAEYFDYLHEIVHHGKTFWSDDTTGHDCFEVASATAAQRAEAFLRTIGKWEDGE